MGWFSTQPANDIDKGRLALSFFHNDSIGLGQYRDTLESLISKVGGKNPTAWLEDFGFAINTLEMSTGQVQDAMEDLANASQGKIPTPTVFFQALSKRISNPTFGDYVGATPKIAADSALTVVKGAAEVGNAVLDTGKSLLVIGPIVAVGAILFIVYARTRSIAGR